jgi:hypothetical protein
LATIFSFNVKEEGGSAAWFTDKASKKIDYTALIKNSNRLFHYTKLYLITNLYLIKRILQ